MILISESEYASIKAAASAERESTRAMLQRRLERLDEDPRPHIREWMQKRARTIQSLELLNSRR